MSYSASDSACKQPAGLRQTRLLLLTTYATIVSGAALLGVAEHALGYAAVAVVLCAGHGLLVGPAGKALLPPAAGQLLAIAALAFGLMQAAYTSVDVSYGLAHFLVLVQLIKLYGTHTVRDLRLIHVAAIFVILVASIWAQELLYVPAFLLAAGSLMWGLAVLALFPPVSQETEANRRARTWATGRHMASALLLPAVVVLLGTAVFFVLLPRLFPSRSHHRRFARQMVGFSENVSLREVGPVGQSDRVVMRVQFRALEDGRETAATPRRMLMRGQSLAGYHAGRWSSVAPPESAPAQLSAGRGTTGELISKDVYLLRSKPVARRSVLQSVAMEGRPSNVLFALYRLTWADMGGSGIERLAMPEHTVTLREPLRPGDSYNAISLVPQFAAADLRRVGTPPPDANSWIYWQLPPSIRPTLQAVADDVLRTYPAQTDYDRVLAVQRYLKDAGRFRYTLDLPPFGSLDPIEAFLTETRAGSCEQFATAMALILRVWGIPTRLATGFKGGDYEPASQAHVFRDKHAHAWVEVCFRDRGWVEFDPTPDTPDLYEEASETGAVGGLLSGLQSLATGIFRRIRRHWESSILGFSRAKQRRVFEELSAVTSSLAERAGGIVGPLMPGLPGSGLVQVASLVVLLTVGGMGFYLAARWTLARLGHGTPGGSAVPPVWFYRDMVVILNRKGIRRPPHLTPREFVPMAAAQLAGPPAGGGPSPRAALDLVTDLFYQVRFGGREPAPEQSGPLRAALDSLRKAARVAPGVPAAPGPGPDSPP